jgi:hypothetical protein
MADQHADELPEDFKLMRRYDAEWNAPRLISWGAVFLALAIAVIYTLASIGGR